MVNFSSICAGLVLVACTCVVLSDAAVQYRPVVLMHGLLGDAGAMSDLASWLQADFPGIYVKNVEIGNGKYDSLFMNINDQCDNLAQQILADSHLSGGFNLVGHSQGGLLTRCVIQRFGLPVFNYVSLAGPNDGVYGVPDLNSLCPDVECPWLVDVMDLILENGWTDPLVQDSLSFAAYWKDPFQYDLYLNYSHFLPDLNNERAVKNATYRANLLRLNKMILIYSTTDEVVIPNTSPWFQFYELDSDSVVFPLKTSKPYLEDWLGIRTIDERGDLILASVPCSHGSMPNTKCKKYYDELYKVYLGTPV